MQIAEPVLSQVPLGRASKHPVAWVVMYSPIPPVDVVNDGGELLVTVDLESGEVGLRPW